MPLASHRVVHASKCRWSSWKAQSRKSVARRNFTRQSGIVFTARDFYLAEEAPICSVLLRGAFGYNSITPMAKAILEGTYDYPPDFYEATKEVLQECVLIQLRVPKNSISTNINPVDLSNHWRLAR
jgi:hypothetical protein